MMIKERIKAKRRREKAVRAFSKRAGLKIKVSPKKRIIRPETSLNLLTQI